MEQIETLIVPLIKGLTMLELAIHLVASVVGIALAVVLSGLFSKRHSSLMARVDRIVILTPFVLFALLHISAMGSSSMSGAHEIENLIKWAMGGMIAGMWWINRSIKIEV